MESYDEGLGTVYERFMLNDYFDDLINSYNIKNVLEVPIYGMTGLTGINSVHLAMKGCNISLVDTKEKYVTEAMRHLENLPIEGRYNILLHKDISKLPYSDNYFDLVWNFAAVWHVKNAGSLLDEMARVSSRLVLVFIPNRKQLGYALRKYVFDRHFFDIIDESWIDLDRISRRLKSHGMKVINEGLIDVPVWPDTAVPVKSVFRKILKKDNDSTDKSEQQLFKKYWNWDIMSYYMGNNPSLKDKIEKLAFLEKMSIPWHVKAFWAHHRYVLCSKN